MVTAAKYTSTKLTDILAQRGIADVCNDAGWSPYTHKGFSGWRYPLYNLAGQHYRSEAGAIWRWKNAEPKPLLDDDGRVWQKYAWLPSKPDRAKYYLLPDTLQAIKDKGGVVYLASGEPDVMAYRAAGMRNTLCWFDGETSIPSTLLSDLELMHVRLVNVYPDLDATGMQMAARLSQLFQDSRFAFHAYHLPGVVSSKNDINWLWQYTGFDAERFTNALYDAKKLDQVTLDLYQQNDAPKLVYVPSDTAHTDDLPQGFIDALIRHVESRPGFKRWDGDGWGNYKCDLPGHDDSAASAGFNRETMAFKCFVCGSMNARDYGRAIVPPIEISEHYPKPLNVVTLTGKTSDISEVSKPAAPAQNDDEPLYEVGSKVGLDIIAELRGERIPNVQPVEFPLKSLHRLGGFARMMWPGKLAFISGVSGGGKTSMGETISELFQQDGHDVIWYNPEWSAQEMRIRALQRQGGLTMTEYAEMTVHNIDTRNGITQQRGRGLDSTEIDTNVRHMERILSWPGDVYSLRQSAKLGTMQAICDTVEGVVTQMRANGRLVSAFFFDYIQRAPKAGVAGWEAQEWVVSQIKSLCERLSLFGFVFVQPTKGASKATRDGAALTEGSGQGLSDQQANLYITMTPAFNGDGDKYPYTRLNVVKNSMGQSGKVYLKWSYQYLTVVDEEITEDYINEMGWGSTEKESKADD